MNIRISDFLDISYKKNIINQKQKMSEEKGFKKPVFTEEISYNYFSEYKKLLNLCETN